MKSEYELTINDYLAIIKDRALLLGLSGVLILAASVAVAISIPPVYESSGTILVESQQISPDLIAANNNSYADERIEVIRQRVMTRENLLRIIDKYNLYAGSGRQLSESDKIDQMRNSITVTTLSTSVKGRGEVTVAFQVAFDDRRPDLAKDVANELVTLFLDENIKQRTERASETTEFLSQEANKLGAELANGKLQLLVAVASPKPALLAEADAATTADQFFPRLLADAKRAGLVLAAGVRSFKLDK